MTIENLIRVLSSRSHFSISALSGDSNPLRGHGVVEVSQLDGRIIIFEEQGVWTSPDHLNAAFRNVYCWSFHNEARTVGLAHFRHGWNRPVDLIDFIAIAPDAWQHTIPHSCGADLYSAQMHYSGCELRLFWKIQGPRKDQEIEYVYV
jgi:hypothetical protein